MLLALRSDKRANRTLFEQTKDGEMGENEEIYTRQSLYLVHLDGTGLDHLLPSGLPSFFVL